MRRLLLTAVLLNLLSQALFSQDLEKLRAALRSYDKDATVSFRHTFTELNGDRLPDAVVLLSGPNWCGSGGCNMLVFRGTQAGFAFVSSSTITNEPIRISPEKSAGWNNLIVSAKGVGDVVMRFNGARYPLNPSVQAKATAAQIGAAKTILESSMLPGMWAFAEAASFASRQSRYSTEPGEVVVLQDGRELTVQFEDGNRLTAIEMNRWPRGKAVLVAYNLDYGAALVDPESSKYLSILLASEGHPFERMRDLCMETAGTTGEMVSCHATEQSQWDKDLNRIYGLLMASLDGTQKQSVQNAQREWIQYRDAQRRAIGETYNDGTIKRVEAAAEIARITKEQAERLARVLGR